MTEIGIDPGLGKSGVAIFHKGKLMQLHHMNLWQIFCLINKNEHAKFYVENSNVEKSNWHGMSARGNVGKNKAISQEIVNHCRRVGVELVELRPRGYSKQFAGAGGKRIFEQLTGWDGSSNEHNRAASAMVIGNSMLKLRNKFAGI